MREPQLDQMQAHQPSYLAHLSSAQNGCELCKYFWAALGNDTYRPHEVSTTKRGICVRYPGRALSLNAWGTSDGMLDGIRIVTTGEVPDTTESEDERDIFDPTLPPDGQGALSGYLDLFVEEGA